MIGRETNTSDLRWFGIMRGARCTSPCLAMWPKPEKNSGMICPHVSSAPPIHILCPNMVPNGNSQISLTLPPLDDREKKLIQKVNGKFLYLGRAIDLTMLTALSTLASQQAAPTEETSARAQ